MEKRALLKYKSTEVNVRGMGRPQPESSFVLERSTRRMEIKFYFKTLPVIAYQR